MIDDDGSEYLRDGPVNTPKDPVAAPYFPHWKKNATTKTKNNFWQMINSKYIS